MFLETGKELIALIFLPCNYAKQAVHTCRYATEILQ
jgi:hypothetical protein